MHNDLLSKEEKKGQLSLTPLTEKIEVKHVEKIDAGPICVMNKTIQLVPDCQAFKWAVLLEAHSSSCGQTALGMYSSVTEFCEVRFLISKGHDPGGMNKS